MTMRQATHGLPGYKHRIHTLPQPPYHPDIATLYFFLFSGLKQVMKEQHNISVWAIEEAVMRELRSITVSEFEEIFRHWQICWKRCTDTEGLYFEDY